MTNALISLGNITRPEEFRGALAGAKVHGFASLIPVGIPLPLELMFGYLKSFAQIVSGLFIGVGGIGLANPLKAIVKPAVSPTSDLLAEDPILIPVLSLVLTCLALKFLVNLARGIVLKRAEHFLDPTPTSREWPSSMSSSSSTSYPAW